jgi:hypothetical protein
MEHIPCPKKPCRQISALFDSHSHPLKQSISGIHVWQIRSFFEDAIA